MTDKDDGLRLPDDEPGHEPDSEQPANEGTAGGSRHSRSGFGYLGEQYARLLTNLYSSVNRSIIAGFTPPNIAGLFPSTPTASLLSQLKMPMLGINPVALNIGKSLSDVIQMHQAATIAPLAGLLEKQRTQ